jgi:hypothetical protein
MKKLATLFLLLIASAALASVVVMFNPTTGQIGQVIPSADTLAYLNRNDALINPAFPATPLALCWVTNGAIVAKTQAHLDGEFQAQSNAVIAFAALIRSNDVDRASRYMFATNAEGRILRMFALLTLDQINVLRKTNGMSIITTNVFLNAMSNAVAGDTR